MVSNRFTLSRPFSRFEEEMLARLALGSGRRISSTSLASARRKSSELTLWLQVAVFTHLSGENRSDVTTRHTFSGYTMQKGVSPCYVGPFLSHFSRHIPPRSGPPLHGQCSYTALSPDLSPSDCIFRGFERDSRCIGFVIVSPLCTFQQMCHLIPWLTLAINCT